MSRATRVLLLEDNVIHEGLLRDELEDSGFEVKTARTVEGADKALKTFTPDALILDVVIRGDHLSVFKWVLNIRSTESFRSVPILFVTAFSRNFQEEIDLIPNAKLLSKPFAFEDLFRSLKSLLDAKKSSG